MLALPAVPTTPTVTGSARIFGNSRYETSFGIANEYKSVLGAEKFESVIIASGVNFPDALAGSYLAAVKNAPILIAKVKSGQLQNAAELKNYSTITQTAKDITAAVNESKTYTHTNTNSPSCFLGSGFQG